jgi:Na+/glutamate symporter
MGHLFAAIFTAYIIAAAIIGGAIVAFLLLVGHDYNVFCV